MFHNQNKMYRRLNYSNDKIFSSSYNNQNDFGLNNSYYEYKSIKVTRNSNQPRKNNSFHTISDIKVKSKSNQKYIQQVKNSKYIIVDYIKWKNVSERTLNNVIFIQRWWRQIKPHNFGKISNIKIYSINSINHNNSNIYNSNNTNCIIKSFKNNSFNKTYTFQNHNNSKNYKLNQFLSKTIKHTNNVYNINNIHNINDRKKESLTEQYENEIKQLKTQLQYFREKYNEILYYQSMNFNWYNLTIETFSLTIESSPFSPFLLNFIIETNCILDIFAIEKPPNIIENIDSLLILNTEKPDNMIQIVNRINISKSDKKLLLAIETIEFFELLPKEKEPLEIQAVDEIFVDKLEKQENIIQSMDKFFVNKVIKNNNFPEARECIEILPIAKEPLISQLVDEMFIEPLERPIYIKQKNDNIEILNSINNKNNKNIIEEPRESIEILRSEKAPLKIQLVDQMFIENLEKLDNLVIKKNSNLQILNSKKLLNNTIEPEESLEIISNIEKKYEKQDVDNMYIESLEKTDNKIQSLGQMEIYNTKKHSKLQEESTIIEILPKKKKSLKTQIVDEMFIEPELKPEGLIEYVENFSFRSCAKKNNIMENINSIAIIGSSNEWKNLKLENRDNLFINQLESQIENKYYSQKSDNI